MARRSRRRTAPRGSRGSTSRARADVRVAELADARAVTAGRNDHDAARCRLAPARCLARRRVRGHAVEQDDFVCGRRPGRRAGRPPNAGMPCAVVLGARSSLLSAASDELGEEPAACSRGSRGSWARGSRCSWARGSRCSWGSRCSCCSVGRADRLRCARRVGCERRNIDDRRSVILSGDAAIRRGAGLRNRRRADLRGWCGRKRRRGWSRRGSGPARLRRRCRARVCALWCARSRCDR